MEAKEVMFEDNEDEKESSGVDTDDLNRLSELEDLEQRQNGPHDAAKEFMKGNYAVICEFQSSTKSELRERKLQYEK